MTNRKRTLAVLDATRPWTPIQACLSLSAVTLDGYFSAFASRVANAPRKLRYHQLCSPASLPTEWTQSGSLSSESSFRWSLSYVHSLTDRAMAYDRHTTIPRHLRSSRKRGTLYRFCQTRHVISLSIELDIHSHYTLVTRDFEINSNDRRNENCKVPYYLNEKNSTLLIFPLYRIVFMRYFLSYKFVLSSCLSTLIAIEGVKKKG